MSDVINVLYMEEVHALNLLEILLLCVILS